MDKDALFREVLRSGKDSIFRICCCYVRDPEDRNDVFQEVLLRVYRHLESFEGRAVVTTWLYRITVNTCLDFLRRQKRSEKVLDRSAELDRLGDPADTRSPADHAMDVEALYNCIGRLPVLDRTLVSLYLEDMSTREIADVLGISEGNVRVKMTRIRESLRRMLEVTNDGPR